MANYNCELYIAEAIDSVLSQTYDDFELIIIDDSSNDNSKSIISQYHKNHQDKINPIFLDENLGQGNAFNLGISMSRGDILCFIDSDDVWFPYKLKNVSCLFEGTKDIALLQHNLFILKDGKITEDKIKNILFSGDYFNYTKKFKYSFPNFVPTSGLSFSRKILEKVYPIPKEFRNSADGYLTRTSFCFGEVLSINSCWGAYRIHENNTTYQNTDFNMRNYKKNILIPSLNDFYIKNNIDLKFHYSGLIWTIFTSIVSYFSDPNK